MKKNDLVTYNGYLVVCLGGERLRETFDEHGHGGMYVPQMKVMVLGTVPPGGRLPASHSRGTIRWVRRNNLKKLPPC